MMKLIKAGLLGGLVIYVWYAASWMAMPWHKTTIHKFKDETAVAQIIQANASVSGIYLMPSMYEKNAATSAEPKKEENKKEEAKHEHEHEPMVFSAVHLEGMPATMTEAISISLLTHIVSAFLVAWLLLQTHNLSYAGRLGFVMIFALSAGIVTEVPMWNWFKFDPEYIMVAMGDLLIGWFLAGLVLAKICTNKK